MCRDAAHLLLSLLLLFIYFFSLPSLLTSLINPRRMHEGYGSRSVCLCVCYRASCYIPRLYIEIRVSLGFLC